MTHETEIYIKKGNLDDSNQELWKCDICDCNVFGNKENHMARHGGKECWEFENKK